MAEKIFDIIKENMKNPKMYIAILISFVVFLILFPYIDANYFYYNRIEKRIKILNEITNVDVAKINKDSVLKEEYDNIILEINKQKDGSLGSVFITKSDKKDQFWKFITGGFISWILSFLCIFSKTIDKRGYKFIAFIFLVLIGFLLGYISTAVPTIFTPWCNYIMMPVLQIVLLGILATSKK